MKLNKILSALMLVAAISFAACEEPIPGPQPGPQPNDSTQTATTVEIPANVNIPADAITVTEARNICAGLASETTSGTKYYVKGWVKKIHSKHAEGVSGYGNDQFYMSENQYTDGTFDSDDFMAYQVYYLNGEKFTSADQVQVGDYVVIYGELTNYNGTYETVGKGAAYIYSTSREASSGPAVDLEYAADEISVSKMLEIGATLAAGDTTEYYKVKGIVKAGPQVNLGYGSATFYITDGTQEFYCYNIKGLNDSALVSGEQIKEGDIVTVYARLYHYVKAATDTQEEQHILELIRGHLTATTNDFDPSTVTGPKEITIAEAIQIGNALGKDETSAEQYILKGTVTEIKEASTSYGNLTFYIKDNSTEETFYIFRVYYLDNQKYTENDPTLEIDDEVVVVGQIQNYKGTTLELVKGYVKEHNK